jgi:hypothetical protein
VNTARTQFEIPAAGQIEAAMDNLPNDATRAACIHELDVSGKSEGDIQLRRGYILGLATARVLIIGGGWTRDDLLRSFEATPAVTAEYVENPSPEQLKEAAREMDEATREEAKS